MTTPNYFRRDDDDIVTQYSVQRLFARPNAIPGTEAAALAPPPRLRFILPCGHAFEAPTEREISIGRRSRPTDPMVTIDLQTRGGVEGGVSRYHAMVVVVRGVLYVRDLNSVNGTFLEGKRLRPIVSYPLTDGNVLLLGALPLRVEFC